VYRLPPRTRSGGHRAEEWGLDHPLWTGRLRVVGQDDACLIRLEDAQTGELFAAGPYTLDGRAVETAMDSSRYFVLRVEDAGRHAFIGVGFRERNDAFDFNATLQAYLR
ncbi:Necap1 protein, partial [Syncephalis pseudoplumigaleata]